MTRRPEAIQFFLTGFLISFFALFCTTEVRAKLSDSLQQKANLETENLDYLKILKKGAQESLINIDLAIYYTDLALDKARKTKDPEAFFHIHRDRGFIYEENNQLRKALTEFEHALHIVNQMDNDPLRLSIYTDLAIANRKLGNYKATTDYHTLCIFLAEKTGNLVMMENSYHGLGILYELLGDYDKALEHYFKSVAIAEEREDISGVILTLQHISNTFIKTYNKDKAIEHIERAYDLALTQGDSLEIANVLYDYGKIHNQLEEYDEALEKLTASLNVYKNVHQKTEIVLGLIEVSDVYTKMGYFEKAQENFQLCFDKYATYMSAKDQAHIYNKQAFLFQKLKETDRAEADFLKSLKISKNNDYKSISQANHSALYEIYKKRGDTQKALAHLEASNKLRDYIQNAEKSKRIADLQFQYEVEQGERKIQELRYSRNHVLFVCISLFLAALALFFFYTNKTRIKNNRALKKKNIAFEEQNRKLKESNQALSQFAYVAAHDLKEPLRNIGSFISLLQKKYGHQFNDEANNYMDYVQRGAVRMNSLLIDLLEFSTLTIQEVSNEIISIHEVVDEVSRNLQDTISRKQAIIKYDKSLPSIRMKRIHLLQVLQNLISNSLKFVETTPIINIQHFLEPDHILIMIEDNGIGIKEEYREKVFKLFHQLEKNKGYDGTGIGLTICKSIVEKYHGEIWFETRVQGGTRFFIRLPLRGALPKKANTPKAKIQKLEETYS